MADGDDPARLDQAEVGRIFREESGRSVATLIGVFQAPMVLASKSVRGMSPKVGRMRFSTFLRVPYSEVGCWSLPGWPPLGRHVVAEQGPGPLQVNLVRLDELVTARSIARCSASARRLVGKMPAERCRLPSW